MKLIRRYRSSLAFAAYVALSIVVVITFARGEDTRNIVIQADQPHTVKESCIPFRKVDRGGRLLALTRCEPFGKPPVITAEAAVPAVASPPVAAAAPESDSDAPAGSGVALEPGKGGAVKPPAPPGPDATPEPAPPVDPAPVPAPQTSPAPVAVTPPSAPPPQVPPPRPIRDAVGGAVQGVANAPCALVRALCPPED